MKLIKMTLFLATCTSLAMTTACNYKIDKTSGGSNNAQGKGRASAVKILKVEGDSVTLQTPGGKRQIKSNQVNFEIINAAFLKTYCLECHSGSSAPQGSDFSSFEKAAKWAPRMLARAQKGDMPPKGDLPTDPEKKALEIWISNGTPQ